MKWLCGIGGIEDQFQVMPCQVESCRQYGDWSEWSSCSKICGGYTIRTRQCNPNAICDGTLLKQVKVCAFKDCDTLLLCKKKENFFLSNFYSFLKLFYKLWIRLN